MKKKDFNLIVLLVVILILVIIAIPIITNIIEDSKKVSFERSVEGILEETKLDVSLKLDEKGYEYKLEDGKIDELKDSNTKGYNGVIRYDSASNVSYAIYNDSWCVIKTNNESTITKYNGECSLPVLEITTLMYNDGDIVYYDVLQGKTCNNYHIDNSKTNYNGTSSTKTTDNQNSCLKFYAFNDDEGDNTVDLLLDHNTTATISWTSAIGPSEVSYNDNINGTTLKNVVSKATVMPMANIPTGYNAAGPKEVIEQLKIDTDSWVGTVTPENYTVSQTDAGNYTIKYKDNNYKARLITANEIAEITGNSSFNEITSDYENWYNFDTNSYDESDTYNYGWLYDRTSLSCINYGCLNNSDSETYGYWTSTSTFGSLHFVWYVYNHGSLGSNGANTGCGIRPVITIYKYNL